MRQNRSPRLKYIVLATRHCTQEIGKIQFKYCYIRVRTILRQQLRVVGKNPLSSYFCREELLYIMNISDGQKWSFVDRNGAGLRDYFKSEAWTWSMISSAAVIGCVHWSVSTAYAKERWLFMLGNALVEAQIMNALNLKAWDCSASRFLFVDHWEEFRSISSPFPSRHINIHSRLFSLILKGQWTMAHRDSQRINPV